MVVLKVEANLCRMILMEFLVFKKKCLLSISGKLSAFVFKLFCCLQQKF